jgi:hypothetical protein
LGLGAQRERESSGDFQIWGGILKSCERLYVMGERERASGNRFFFKKNALLDEK